MGGAPTSAHPAVVGLVGSSGIYCSGVLLHPRVVLTAGHCADGSPTAVSFGDDGNGEQVRVLASVPHPDYSYIGLENDLGFLVLEDHAVAVSAMAVFSETPSVDDSVLIVGFGDAGSDGESGTKRAGSATIESIDPAHLALVPGPAIACRGDSGGPVLIETTAGYEIAGVVSSGDEACTRTTATRLEAYSQHITTMLDRATRPGAVGAACWSELNCPQPSWCQRPAPTDDIGYCTVGCSDDDDCGNDSRCVAGQDGSWCVPEIIPGAQGTACADATDCSAGSCLATLDDTVSRCYELCTSAGIGCTERGGECTPVANSNAQACVPASSSAGCHTSSGPPPLWPIVLVALLARRARRAVSGDRLASGGSRR